MPSPSALKYHSILVTKDSKKLFPYLKVLYFDMSVNSLTYVWS